MHRFIEALGTKIFCEVSGEGTPILLVHGLGGTGNVWHGQRVAFSKFFKVVTLDLPGSGRSEKNPENDSMEKWSEQLQAVADGLALEQFVLVGHSMSTILAQKFAARFPARLSGLVLCGPLTEQPPTAKEAFAKRAEAVRQDGMLAVADTVLAGALTAATREANPILTGLYREMLLSHDPEAYAAQCHALINGSAKSDQPKILAPTLILLGEQDAVTPLGNARAILANLRGAQLRIIPATAHLTMAERPELFNAALMEFLVRL